VELLHDRYRALGHFRRVSGARRGRVACLCAGAGEGSRTLRMAAGHAAVTCLNKVHHSASAIIAASICPAGNDTSDDLMARRHVEITIQSE